MKQRKLSSFAIITIFICLSIIGVSLLPLLSVQLIPNRTPKSLSVSFRWKDASAQVVEKEVTSKLEGVFNTIKGVKKVSSTSQKGYGNIQLAFKDGVDMQAVNFEVATLIRKTYSELPEEVSYPSISKSDIKKDVAPILSYSINANESPHYIKKFTNNHILPHLTNIKRVKYVKVYGSAPYEWIVMYNTDKLLQLNISANDISRAIDLYFSKKELGSADVFKYNTQKFNEAITVTVTYRTDDELNWNYIPVKKINNRIVYLKDIATVKYKEGDVKSYYRINGLNTINMAIYAEKGVNTIQLSKVVREKVNAIKKEIPISYSIKMTNDTTKFLVQELNKIQIRTLLSLLILFLFVIIIYRNVKYLVILFFSILANLLIAVIFYYLFKIQLQLYSFAGITISFGIIIDNSIIMIDHIRNKGNKKVFLAILASTLTTIGALMIVFFLDENERLNLWDFVLVLAINISVSLLVALYLIPSLLDKFKLQKEQHKVFRKRKRKVVKYTDYYQRIIYTMKKRKFKWLFVMIFILGFGLPIHFLPLKMEGDNQWIKTYNSTLGSELFTTQIRPILEKVLGGSLRLFTEAVKESVSFNEEPQRTKITILSGMPDGCTIQQLNEVVVQMENYIGQFNEIELYETKITSYRYSSITIYFKKEFEFGAFPFTLKNMLENKAISLGGADWSISGVGRGFSNQMYGSSNSSKIELEGYNYDRLYEYAQILKKQLQTSLYKDRIKDISIGSERINTYFLDFNQEQLAQNNVSKSQLYNYLKNQVYSNNIVSFVQNDELQQVKLLSNQFQKFNVWDLQHTPIPIGNKQYKLDKLASITKRLEGSYIEKTNQQYHLLVTYNFLGPAPLEKKVKDINIKKLQSKMAVGYRVYAKKWGQWNFDNSTQYYYIFIVIFIIFLICTVLLESLWQPLAIISMIPLSFMGVFLTFSLFEFSFDQGGYASFILLCGISVNSALYIVNDYNNLKKKFSNKNLQILYFKAFNNKITPIILTIVSTIIGLIPFVFNREGNVFWFSFAVGSIGGLIFSLIGLIFYLPLFIKFTILPEHKKKYKYSE